MEAPRSRRHLPKTPVAFRRFAARNLFPVRIGTDPATNRFQFSTLGLLRFVTDMALLLGLVLWFSRVVSIDMALFMHVAAALVTTYWWAWRRSRERLLLRLTWLELLALVYVAMLFGSLMFTALVPLAPYHNPKDHSSKNVPGVP